MEVDAKALAGALRQVVPAASTDDSRPILTGVLLAAEEGGLRLVATDSYRLAVRDLPGAQVLREGQSVLLPSRALGELTRLLTGASTVELRLGERAVYQWCPLGVSKSRVKPAFWRSLGPVATTRNQRTVDRILAELDRRA